MAAARESIAHAVADALGEALGREVSPLDPGKRFRDLGLTSLRAAEFTARLARHLARSLPATLVWDHPTPAQLIAHLSGDGPSRQTDQRRPMAADEPVALIAFACRFPGATDPEAFWQNLVEGVESVRDMPPERIDAASLYDPDPARPGRIATRRGGFLDQVDRFDAAFFGISPREALEMDPQQRLILELAWEALERAQLPASRLAGSRTGVFMGAMWSEYAQVAGGIESIAQHSATGRDTGVIANRVSYALGLMGPSLTVNTACSSSLVAVHLACQSLRSGESTLALAGGVNLMLAPDGTVAMTKFGAMAPDGRSKAFDASADGYVRGEGAGVVLLKPLTRAIADGDPILAVIRGSAVNNDGPSNGLTAPNPEAQRAVLRDACADARVEPAEVDYVEAHGTGTMLGDPIEAGALGAVLGAGRPADRPLLIGSAKTNIGHLESAAGVAGLIKAALALRHREIPPSLHFNHANPHIDFDALRVRVVRERQPWPVATHPPRAGVSSFGFGGTNAHVILERWADDGAASAAEPQVRRAQRARGVKATTPRRLAFVFSGNGSQWPAMGRMLLHGSADFRAAVIACDRAFRDVGADVDVLGTLAGTALAETAGTITASQAALFALQVGLARTLAARGFQPDAVVGHSLGEVAAAHVAGALSLAEAAQVVWHRSRLQAQAAGSGAMALVVQTEADVAARLPRDGSVSIAGVNAPRAITLSGASDALDQFVGALAREGIETHRIRVDVAYHSPAMDRFMAPLGTALEGLRPTATGVAFHSTVTGRRLEGTALGAAYWPRNLRQPVRLADAVQAMPDAVFVEISPHPVLASALTECLAPRETPCPVLCSLSRDDAAADALQRLENALAEQGVARHEPPAPRPAHLLTLSARTPSALRALALRYAQALPEEAAEACHAANAGREPFPHRAAVVGADAAALREGLQRLADGESQASPRTGTATVGAAPAWALTVDNVTPRWRHFSRAAQFAPLFDAVQRAANPLLAAAGVDSLDFALAATGKRPAHMDRAIHFCLGVAVSAQLRAWGIAPLSVTGEGPAREITRALETPSAFDAMLQSLLQGESLRDDAATSTARDCVTLTLADGDAWETLLGLVATCFVGGARPDWEGIDAGLATRPVTLPTYPFERERFWPREVRPNAAPSAYAIHWVPLRRDVDWAAPETLVSGLPPAPKAQDAAAQLDRLAAAYAAAAIADGALNRPSQPPIETKAHRRQRDAIERMAHAAARGENPDALAASLTQRHPDRQHEIAAIQRVGRALPRLLADPAAIHTILFPEGDLQPLGALYERSAFARGIGESLQRVFASLARDGTALRVIELGGGTGGTTAHLMPLLPPTASYTFTDVSEAFLSAASRRFGTHPGWHTTRLDLEAPLENQGLSRSHDVAVAVNVLHATRDLEETLTHAHRLLRPGGLLLLAEITGAAGWLDLVFGFFDGWWRFEDVARRPGHALLDDASWQALLNRCGFDAVGTWRDGDRQTLFVARAGPSPGRRLVIGAGPLAEAVRVALEADGLAVELREAVPAQGDYVDTFVVAEAITPTTLVTQWQSLAGSPRFGRLHPIASGDPTLAAAVAAASADAVARCEGLASPSRRAASLTVENGSPLSACGLLAASAEDRVRTAREGDVAARLTPRIDVPTSGPPVRPDRSYLITGGQGALGLAFAEWLVGRGARFLTLVGRRPPSPVARDTLARLAAAGATVRTVEADVADDTAVSSLLAALDREAPPLAGIVHAAGVGAGELEDVFAGKWHGAHHLHEATRHRPLDVFLLFSSAAATWGAAGKGAYAAANASLEALSAHRRRNGHRSLAVAWGRFEVLGLLDAAEDRALAEMGLGAMPTVAAFDLAWRLLDGPDATVTIAAVDWPRFRAVCELRGPRPFFSELPAPAAPAAPRAGPDPVSPSVVAPAAGDTVDAVRREVARMLGHADPAALPTDAGLFSLGLDSLLAVQLRARLEALAGKPVPTAILFSHPTIAALAAWMGGEAPASARAATALAPADDGIAIIGVGCRFPGGAHDWATLTALLHSDRDGVGEVPASRWDWRQWPPDPARPADAPNRWGAFLDDVDQFDAAFFGITPKEAAFMDPQQRLLLETAWEALAHAGEDPLTLAGARIGVFAGLTGSDYATLARRDAARGLEAQAIVGQPANAAAGRIAFALGLTGPALVVDTACSSSLMAIHLACRSLRAGDCDAALAGGVNLMLSPETSVILARAGMLSPTGRCRTFDDRADGFVRAEGAALVLLKPLQRALADGDRVLAVVRGSAANHDGRASGFTVPNGTAQAAVIRAALADARVAPTDVGYVEAHGTGTALGDPIEAHALAEVYGASRPSPLLVGSVKSRIGHAESAAGVAGLLQAVLALDSGRIPATLHFTGLNRHIAPGPLAVAGPDQAFPPAARRIAAVSAFGASGTNVHVVLEDAPPEAMAAARDGAREARAAALAPRYQRKRHWLDWAHAGAPSSLTVPSTPAEIASHLYRTVWAASPTPTATTPWRGSVASDSALAATLRRALAATDFRDSPAPQETLWVAPAMPSASDIAPACRALEAHVASNTGRLWVVTAGAQAPAADATRDPHASAVWGYARALALREPDRIAGVIDLPAALPSAHVMATLGAFLASPGDEDTVAIRDDGLHVLRLTRVTGTLPGEPAVRSDGTYLITGGFGALGLALARHLAQRGARHIALLGRHVPSTPPTLPADVVPVMLQANVADADAMRVIGERLASSMPPVVGLFHAAGLASDDVDEALQPKLGGLRTLDALTEHWPLEAFVAFSSAAAAWGDATLPAYVAANTALEAAVANRRLRGKPGFVLAPARFDVRGMLDAAGAARFDRLGLDALPVDAVYAATRALAAAGEQDVVAAAVRWPAFASVYRSRRARPFLDRVAPSLDALTPQRLAVRGADLLRRLQDLVAEILGQDDASTIDVDTGFFALGLDSFAVVDLRRRVETSLSVSLPTSELFDASSIAKLARALERHAEPTAPLSVPGAFPSPAPAAVRTPARGQPVATRTRVREPIAIVGAACRLPGGVRGLDDLARLLQEGRDAIGPLPADRGAAWETLPEPYRRGGFLDGIADFDADFFGISPREAAQIDPQHRLLLEVAWEAIEHAGRAVPSLSGSRTGVFVGITGAEYAELMLNAGATDAHAVGGRFLNAAAGRLAHTLGLNGPTLAVDTACSSSAMAIHLACQSLAAGECDTALAGGVNLLLSPETTRLLIDARMLSPNARCAPFDEAADGYVRAEACGLVLLKPLSLAEADGDRILAVLRGSAANHDGAASGYTVPNGDAQQAVIRAALASAGLSPADIAYVEAHGTGTTLGDPIELQALAAVFGTGRRTPLAVGSIKSQIGHAEAAAGIAGLLKVIASLSSRQLAPTLHQQRRNPHIRVGADQITVPDRATAWVNAGVPRRAGVSSFGASGTNVHLVVEEASLPAPRAGLDGPVVRALSARRAEDIAVLAQSVAEAPDPAAATLAATCVRDGLPWRAVVIADRASTIPHPTGELKPTRAGRPTIAFAFPGQGAQFAGMARGLYATQPAFRDALDDCARALSRHLDAPLERWLFDDQAPLVATERVQPALFAVGCALGSLWRHWGVEPVAVIGHSVGELAAACHAGALTLESAAELACVRGRLMGALPAGGAMAAVLAPAEAVQLVIDAGGGEVVIAARNAPANTTISGPATALQRVVAGLEQAGHRAVPLAVSHAFHSPQLDPMLPALEAAAARLPTQPAVIPVACNLDGSLRRDVDAAYWRAQARSPVAFADGVASLATLGCDLVIEMGPQPVLCGIGRQCLPGARWVPSLTRGQDDARAILEAAAAVWTAGAPLAWARVLDRTPADLAPVAPYPFRRSRVWFNGEASASAPATHERDLARQDVPECDDCDGLVHVGLHLAFVELALAEFARAGSSGRRFDAAPCLAEVRFERPLVLDAPRRLRWEMSAGGDFRLRAAAPGTESLSFLRLQVRERDKARLPARLDAERLSRQLGTSRSAEAFYGALAERGFPLGPSLRRVQSFCYGDTQALARVDGRRFGSEPVAFGLPAGLWEAAAQVAASVGGDSPHGYLLAGWAALHRSEAPATDAAWVQVTWRRDPSDESLRGSIALHDEAGVALALIEGAVLRPARGVAPVAGDATRAWVGHCEWVPLGSLPLPSGTPQPWRLRGTDPNTDALAARLTHNDPARYGVHASSLAVLMTDDVTHEEAALATLAAEASALPRHARLAIITRGSQSPTHRIEGVAAAGASAWGLAQALRAERPDLDLRCIDLEAEADPGAALALALSQDDTERDVAWRKGERHGLRLRARAPDKPVAPARHERLVGSGSIEQVAWTPHAAPAPGAGEVRLTVAAAAPTLRDALSLYGQAPASGDGLGCDCAGVIADVGPGVAEWKPGDAVIAYVPAGRGALASQLTLPARFVRAKPKHLSFVAAATLPMPALVAWLALVERAGLRAGETLLVHQAGGAVGLAAIALARHLGARVVATASRSKHAALSALGVDVIGDSRTGAFDAACRACVGERGVDVALGAFDDTALAAARRALSPTGRLVDLTRVARDGGIDLDHDAERNPAAFAKRFDQVATLAAQGVLPPLPHETLPATAAAEALRRLSLGQVIGRPCLVLAPDADETERGSRSMPTGTWLITGASGALGRALAASLAPSKTGGLVLVDQAALEESFIASLRQRGVPLIHAVADVGDEAAMAALLDRASRELPPLVGIAHAAGVVVDAPVASCHEEDFARAFAGKVRGARVLDRLTRDRPVARFVLFSSLVSVLPSARQGAYAAANAALAQIARQRRERGLAATALHFGPWQAGLGASQGERARATWARWGVTPLESAEGLALLARWGGERHDAIVARIDWAAYAAQTDSTPACLQDVLPARAEPTREPEARASEPQALVNAALVQVLRWPPGRAVDVERPFTEQGLDSLLAAEFAEVLGEATGLRLPATLAYNHPTPAAVARFLEAQSVARAPAARPAPSGHEPIAVVGIGCRFPGADTPDAFFDLLQSGATALGAVPATRAARFANADEALRQGGFFARLDGFDVEGFGFAPAERDALDPHLAALLEVSRAALRDAGALEGRLAGSRTGVYVALGAQNFDHAEALLDTPASPTQAIAASFHSLMPGHLSYHFDLRGPSLVVDAACASGLVAVHLACQALRRGECDSALAGAANLVLSPRVSRAVQAAGLWSARGAPRVFDAEGDGFVRGEGAVTLVLERLSDALAAGRTVHAVIHGSAVGQDGRSNGLTAPNGPSQEAVLHAALQDAHTTASRVGYVEAHATGTALGDAIEAEALAAVFGAAREAPLVVGAVKPSLGHLEAASGLAALLKVILAAERGRIPPTLAAPARPAEWPGNTLSLLTTGASWPAASPLAGVSAFGMSGTNAHVIVGPPPDAVEPGFLATLGWEIDAEASAANTRGPMLLAGEAALVEAMQGACQQSGALAHAAPQSLLASPDAAAWARWLDAHPGAAVWFLCGPSTPRAQAVNGLLALLHALVRPEAPPRPLRVAAVDGVTAEGAATSAIVLALARAIALEHPDLHCRALELGSSDARVLASLLAAGTRDTAGSWMRLTRDGAHVPRVQPLATGSRRFRPRPDGCHVITGAFGGIGEQIAAWLVAQGARDLLLLGRHPRPLPAAAAWAAQGVRVRSHAVDVSDAAAVARALDAVAREGVRVATVFHAAGVQDDVLLAQSTAERLNAVLAGKVDGALALREATRGLPLDAFVLFSSVSVVTGLVGAGAYVAANAALGALARRWRNEGVPAIAIAWGTWAQSGMAQAASAALQRHWAALGLEPFPASVGTTALAALLATDNAEAIAARVDPGKLARNLSGAPSHPTLPSEAAPPVVATATDLERIVRETVARVMGLSPGHPSIDLPFGELGLGSLAAVELRTQLAERLGIPVPATLAFNHPSVAAVVRFLARRLGPRLTH